MRIFESTPGTNIHFRRASAPDEEKTDGPTPRQNPLGDTLPVPEAPTAPSGPRGRAWHGLSHTDTRPSATGSAHQLESPTSEMRASKDRAERDPSDHSATSSPRVSRRVESPDTGRARARQALVSKEYARSVGEGGAVVSKPGGRPSVTGAGTIGGPVPGQGKGAIIRGARPNTRKPLPLPIVRTGIPEGATETARASAGIAIAPVRLVCPPGFRILSMTAANVERLREDFRSPEGIDSERFTIDTPPEQIAEMLDLSPIPANKPIAIQCKRTGEESSFEATLFAIPCDEPEPTIAVSAPAPAIAPPSAPGTTPTPVAVAAPVTAPGPAPAPAPGAAPPTGAAPRPIAQAVPPAPAVAPAPFNPFA